MKHVIIGTAGHIDHGKTALIKALTGRDTDRFEEEKRRGITIDLGFTYFDLPDGERAGIIDVPGHERFIHNMTAGVTGMDMVLVVIAADEGIMPQTREHIDILTLLGVERYIIVLTKCDLADEEWLSMAEEEIREELGKKLPSDTPLLRVSAVTGEGIPALKEEIGKMAESIRPRSGTGAARLPVDRVFSVAGFGTVVTGTVLNGKIVKGDKLSVYPRGLECRVRGIQVYNEETDFCVSGQRAALNLSGVDRQEIRRGCVVSAEESMRSGRRVDVRIKMLEDSSRVLKNQMRLHFYSGTSELLCRAVLLDHETLLPGESGYAQLRMESDTALRPGDRFIVRFYSPLETIGGGIVLDSDAGKEKRFSSEVLARLRLREEGSREERAELQLREHGGTMVSVEELSRELGLSRSETEDSVSVLKECGRAEEFPVSDSIYIWHAEDERRIREKILQVIGEYLKRYPYRTGIPAAGFRNALPQKMKKKAADAYIEWLVRVGVLEKEDGLFAPAGYYPAEDEAYLHVLSVFRKEAADAGYNFRRIDDMEFGKIPESDIREIFSLFQIREEAVEIVPGVFALPEDVSEMERGIRSVLRENGKITVSEVRDMFRTSRRCAKQMLEYTDRTGMTRKEGAESERVGNL